MLSAVRIYYIPGTIQDIVSLSILSFNVNVQNFLKAQDLLDTDLGMQQQT